MTVRVQSTPGVDAAVKRLVPLQSESQVFIGDVQIGHVAQVSVKGALVLDSRSRRQGGVPLDAAQPRSLLCAHPCSNDHSALVLRHRLDAVLDAAVSTCENLAAR
jgi:hypothetical protein